MSKIPTLVFCYDTLLRYPELLLDFPDNDYGNMVLDLSKTIGAAPMQLAAQFDNEPIPDFLPLRDCHISIPEYSINALCLIRDDPNTPPAIRQNATLALHATASALSNNRVHLRPVSQNSQQTCPPSASACALQAFAQFTSDFAANSDCLLFVSRLPEVQARRIFANVPLHPLPLPSPWEYHGIRYLLVPPSLITQFNLDEQISGETWRGLFPLLPALKPNEYLAFFPASEEITPHELSEQDPIVLSDPWAGEGNSAYRERLGRYSAAEDCVKRCHISPQWEIPRSDDGSGYPAYAAYLHALSDPDISCVIVSGPAGSGKTFAAFNYARESVRNGEFTHAIVLKEGKNVLGAVKGGVQEKMAPMVEFGKDALRNLEYKSSKMRKKRREELRNGRHEDPEGQPTSSVYTQINASVDLSWDNFFTNVPYEYAQGRSIPGAVIIADEFQRSDPDTAYTLLTRQAEESKLIVIGDIDQISASTEQKRRVNGVSYASRLLLGDPKVAQIRLNLILRHPIAATIARNRKRVHRALGLPL